MKCIFFVILLCSTFFGCGTIKDAINDLLSFDISESVPPQTIDGSSLPCSTPAVLGLTLFDMPPIEFTKEKNFPDQGTRVDLINSAKLTKFALSKDDDSKAENFDWLDELTIFASAEGQVKKAIASVKDIPKNSTTINLEASGVDLASYIKADGGFSIESEAVGCPPQQDFKFSGGITINVSASPL